MIIISNEIDKMNHLIYLILHSFPLEVSSRKRYRICLRMIIFLFSAQTWFWMMTLTMSSFL